MPRARDAVCARMHTWPASAALLYENRNGTAQHSPSQAGSGRQRVPCGHGLLATPTNSHPRVDDRGVGLQLAAHEMGHCRLPGADVSRHEHWHWLAGAGRGAVALAHPVSGAPLGMGRAAAPVHSQYVPSNPLI